MALMKAPEGKYDEYVQAIIDREQADVILVVVLGGQRGSGFSVAARPGTEIKLWTKAMREVLDDIDAQYEAELQKRQ